MMFADNMCTCTEKNDPHRYCYTGKCFVCDKKVTVEVPGGELYQYRKGVNIQDAMKSVSVDNREFLMTGTCGSCFANLFKEKES